MRMDDKTKFPVETLDLSADDKVSLLAFRGYALPKIERLEMELALAEHFVRLVQRAPIAAMVAGIDPDAIADWATEAADSLAALSYTKEKRPSA